MLCPSAPPDRRARVDIGSSVGRCRPAVSGLGRFRLRSSRAGRPNHGPCASVSLTAHLFERAVAALASFRSESPAAVTLTVVRSEDHAQVRDPACELLPSDHSRQGATVRQRTHPGLRLTQRCARCLESSHSPPSPLAVERSEDHRRTRSSSLRAASFASLPQRSHARDADPARSWATQPACVVSSRFIRLPSPLAVERPEDHRLKRSSDLRTTTSCRPREGAAFRWWTRLGPPRRRVRSDKARTWPAGVSSHPAVVRPEGRRQAKCWTR